MADNWGNLTLAKEWALYEHDGEPAKELNTHEVGRIDLLARHRSEPRWLVIELKRDRSSDRTMGQILRYMGWIQQNLTEPGNTVEGLIVAHDADPQLRYALQFAPSVSLRCYRLHLELCDPG